MWRVMWGPGKRGQALNGDDGRDQLLAASCRSIVRIEGGALVARQMSRRRFVRTATAAGAAVAGAPLAACTSERLFAPLHLTPADRQTDAPNIIVIFADDLGYGDLSSFGATTIRTPGIDSIAEEGIRLTQFYVPSPVCTPSRAGLLTGRHQTRHGLTRVLLPQHTEGLPSSESTIAEIFQRHAYATGCIGKWHLGHTSQTQQPSAHGFDHFFGVPYANDLRPLPLVMDGRTLEMDPAQSRLTMLFLSAALSWMDKNKNSAFFLYLALTAPHAPLRPSSRFAGRSAAGAYGDVVEELDWAVGQILRALDQMELSRDTLVLFTSDNGPSLDCACGSAGPLRGGKRTVYEGGIRVPCVARWPGRIPAGVSTNAPASTLDLLPTLVALAGLPPVEGSLDGEAIIAQLTGAAESNERTFFYFTTGTEVRAVRRGDWKLLLPFRDQPAELYEISSDPGETFDLASNRPAMVRELSDVVQAWRSAVGG